MKIVGVLSLCTFIPHERSVMWMSRLSTTTTKETFWRVQDIFAFYYTSFGRGLFCTSFSGVDCQLRGQTVKGSKARAPD